MEQKLSTKMIFQVFSGERYGELLKLHSVQFFTYQPLMLQESTYVVQPSLFQLLIV